MLEIRSFGAYKYAIYDTKKKSYLSTNDFSSWTNEDCIVKYCLFDTLEDAYNKYTEASNIDKFSILFPEPWYKYIRIVKYKDKFLIKRWWWIFSEYLDKYNLCDWWSKKDINWSGFNTLEEAIRAKVIYSSER